MLTEMTVPSSTVMMTVSSLLKGAILRQVYQSNSGMMDTLNLACKAKEESMTCEAISLYSGEPASEGYKPPVKGELLDMSTQEDTQPDRKSRLQKKNEVHPLINCKLGNKRCRLHPLSFT